MTKPRNDFALRGRVVSERNTLDPDIKIITLVVKNEYRDIFPEVYCKKELLPEIEEHAYLEIKGYAATGKNTNGTKEVPRLYATNVRPAPKMLEEEFGVLGRFWMPAPAVLCVSGKILKVTEDANGKDTYMRYVIEANIPKSEKTTKLRLDWKKIDRHPIFNIGDEICAICRISTPKKRIGNEWRIFLDLNVLDMGLATVTADSMSKS